MAPEEKQATSHRARAFAQLLASGLGKEARDDANTTCGGEYH